MAPKAPVSSSATVDCHLCDRDLGPDEFITYIGTDNGEPHMWVMCAPGTGCDEGGNDDEDDR